MHEKDNYLKTAELSTEQNCNMIDGVPNNTPIPPTPPELDGVVPCKCSRKIPKNLLN